MSTEGCFAAGIFALIVLIISGTGFVLYRHMTYTENLMEECIKDGVPEYECYSLIKISGRSCR